MKFLRFLKKLLDTVLIVGAITSMICMVVSVIIQVFARFCLPQAPSWTEEVSRIFFIYITAFASGIALERNVFVSLGFLDHYLHERAASLARLFISIISTVFAFIVSYVSLEFVEIGGMQTAPTLNFLTMDYVFISITLMMGMIGIYGVFDILGLVVSFCRHGEKA